MQDSNDIFIRQALKNWAAKHNPPASGRGRLLLLATSRNNLKMKDRINKKILDIHQNGYEIPLAPSYSPAERNFEPISQTRLWLLHVSPLRNMV